jgi:hypothetical protein
MTISESGGTVLQFRLRLVGQAHDCYCRQDIPGIIAVLARLEQLSQHAASENERSRIDLATVYVIDLAARANLDDLNFKECYNLCEDACRLLIQPHLAEGTDSPVNHIYHKYWCGVLDTLADAKWKCILPGSRNRVVPAGEMVERYCTMPTADFADPDRNHPPYSNAWNNLHAYLLCGAMLLKQCHRFDPDWLPGITQAMDRVLPGSLEDPDFPYFWERRIAEAVFREGCTAEELAWLFELRSRRIIRTAEDDLDPSAFLESQANELAFLQEHLEQLRSGAD